MSPRHVHIVRGGASYLPELAAYAAHLETLGWETTVHESAGSVPPDARVVWWICGRVPRDAPTRWPAAFHIHEYASASVPPAAALKDSVKRWTHPKPKHRVFQSEWVRNRLDFTNDVAYSLRDMGVPRAFLDARPCAPAEFDLVYLGVTSRLAAYERALHAIRDAGLSLLIVGAMDESVRSVIGHATCTGRIDQHEVPSQLLRARAGLNLMPDCMPFAEQTSTKVLEYLAVGLPVVGNDYEWFRRTSGEHPGRLHAIDVFDQQAWSKAMAAIAPYEVNRDHLQSLTWESRLKDLPVWAALP